MTDPLITNDKQAMSALKQHGSKIITAILVVLTLFFGWQYYQKNFAKIDTVAADSYSAISTQHEQLALMIQNSDGNVDDNINAQKDALFAKIDTLAAEHGDTVYAWQALMMKARLQADAEDYQGAVATLALANAVGIDDKGLLAISGLQLARVQLANGDSNAAFETINGRYPDSFEPSRQEILGDIYVAKNETESAKTAYHTAWELLSQRQENRALLGLKMQALGLSPKPISPKYEMTATHSNAHHADISSVGEAIHAQMNTNSTTE